MGFRLTTRQTDELLDNYGTGNGRLKYYQFMKLLSHGSDDIDRILTKMKEAMRRERIDMRQEFRRMDRRDHGYLSRREFSNGLQDLGIFNLSDSDVRRIMDRFDKDNDGKIDYQEFRKTLDESVSSSSSRGRNDYRSNSRSDSGSNALTTEISYKGTPSKRGLREEEAITIEILSLRLKERVASRDDRIRVAYKFLERREHTTEEVRMSSRGIDFDFVQTFPIEKERDDAFVLLSDLMKNGRTRDTEIEFRVELMRRSGEVDRILGTCVIDLRRIVEDGSDRQYLPYKEMRVKGEGSSSSSIGDLQVSMKAFRCLDRISRGGRSGSRRREDDRDSRFSSSRRDDRRDNDRDRYGRSSRDSNRRSSRDRY